MIKKLCCIMALLFLCASCAHKEKASTSMNVPTAVGPTAIPSPVSPSVEKEKRADTTRAKEVYSFSLREADVKDILRAIAKQANYSVVIEPTVEGECTVDLKEMTLAKALEYILEPLDLSFKIEGRTIYVSEPKIETMIFPVNYLAIVKKGTSTVGGTSGASVTSGGSGAPGEAIQLKTETESDIWKGLEDNIKNMLSEEGKVAVNKQAHLLVVMDYPKRLKEVKRFLEVIEGTIHRQIMIEARVVEVILNEGFREGINWQILNGKLWDYNINVGQQLRSPIVLPGGADPTAPPFFSLFVGSANLDIKNTFVELLKTQGTVNIVSSPRVATMNNQRAIIKVATQDVYFDVQQDTGTSGSGTTITYTPKFITVGLVLDVIPQINDGGDVLLNIHPMLTTKVDHVDHPMSTGAGTTSTKVPVLDVRETDTIVKVKDGETVIIGGLIQDYKKNEQQGIKGLMSIPLLGKLFSYTVETTKKIELVILLTPRIVYDRGGL